MDEQTLRVNIKFLQISFPVNNGGQRVRRELNIPDAAARLISVGVVENPITGPFVTDYRRYGVGEPGKHSVGFLEDLPKEYMLEVSEYFTVNAGPDDKIYYAQPKRKGIVKFEYSGFIGGFLGPVAINIEDDGHVEPWYLWESTNVGLGDTTVRVIQPGAGAP